jgi:aldehyde:ferredoxin oxidoreductase
VTERRSGTEGFGRNGSLARIDLATGRGSRVEVADDAWRLLGGSGLLGVRHLLENTTSGLDALDPEAHLLFLSSAVAGHEAVGLARCTVVAKSPLTGGIGESRVEGPFGIALKASGVDGLIVEGRAYSPSYVLLEEGRASVHPAGDLWGLDTAATTTALEARHGVRAHVAAIGVSGERLVRFAGIVTDRTHAAARMGLGAVMGAKNLKAVVVMRGVTPLPFDAGVLGRVTADYRQLILGNPQTRQQFEAPGFGAWPAEGDATGYAGGTNYRTSVLPTLPATAIADLRARVLTDSGGCPGCPNDCVKTFANGVDAGAGSLDEEVYAAFALGLSLTSTDTVLDLAASCHLWGIDPVSLSFTLQAVCELAESEELPVSLTNGIAPRFGDEEALLALIEGIATRAPGLEWLGEGVARAVASLPDALREVAEPLALHSKGLEMVSFEPRASAGQALAWAVSPLGPRYELVEHDIDFDPVDGPAHGLEQMAEFGTTEWQPMGVLDETRITRTVALLDLWSGLDTLGICLFAGPPVRELTTDQIARLVAGVTGWTISTQDLLDWGARRLLLMRLYNLREGLDGSLDTLPDRFFDRAIDAGRHRGARLDRDTFASAVVRYYDLTGCDPDGRPTAARLDELGLTSSSLRHDISTAPTQKAGPS